jgi:hypothetical protein
VDLDPKPLESGRKRHLAALTADQRKRVAVHRANVLQVKTEKVELIAACNFSFYIFKTRAQLRAYFEAARKALAPSGMLVLEMSGGPGFIERGKERRRVRDAEGRPFQYTWDQQSYDPMSNFARYAIHFRLPDGSEARDAFTYDWRIWSIPEVRELLDEAGFSRSVVFWEREVRGEGTGEYVPMKEGTNDFCWCAYVVGVR